MNRTVHLACAVIVMLLASSAMGAQMRGGGSSGASMSTRVVPLRMTSAGRASAASAAPFTSGVRAPRQSTVIQMAPNGRGISSTGSFANSVDFGDEIGVPGLGFDYAHLAAVG